MIALAIATFAGREATACVNSSECLNFDPCAVNIRCEGGNCVSDPRVCPGDTCNPGRCEPGTGCVQDHLCQSDGLICNGIEFCMPIFVPLIGFIPTCQTTGPLSCDDGNACTIDSQCTEPFGCTHTAMNCDDGDACTSDGCKSDTGCVHEFIEGCCRKDADCLPETDKCTMNRLCVNTFCTLGTPIDCDDGDACTTDSCDSQTGCSHTSIPDCRTTTQPTCHTDADCTIPCATGRTCSGGTCTNGSPVVCDDGDPCTTDSCDPAHGCITGARTGFDVLACVCERVDPPPCTGQSIPRSIGTRVTRGCKAVALAANATGKKRTRLVGKAAKLFAAAAMRATHAAGHKGLAADCGNALAATFTDDRARAITVRGKP